MEVSSIEMWSVNSQSAELNKKDQASVDCWDEKLNSCVKSLKYCLPGVDKITFDIAIDSARGFVCLTL